MTPPTLLVPLPKLLKRKSSQPAYSQIHKWWSSSRARDGQPSPKVIWTGTHQHTWSCLRARVEIIGPSPARAWGLPQHHVCYNYLTAGKLESLPWNLFTGAAVFSLPSHLHPCCPTGFLPGDIHPSRPWGVYRVRFWVPASVGDSWVSPKQSIAICILMKVGHCLSLNVVKWNNCFPTEWPDMTL